jgi:hypothetical protein
MKAWKLKSIATILGGAGILLRIAAYQGSSSPHACPEWVFNIDSIGYFLEMLYPLLLVEALAPRSFLLFPASWYAFIALFDMCKELSGINQSKTMIELFLFWFFFSLITIIVSHVYRKRNPD